MSSGIDNKASPAALGLISNYRPPVDSCDELRTSVGELREPWPRFVEQLEARGISALVERRDHARNRLRENGCTYSVYGAPQGPDRPWELDPLPLLIGEDEWRRLSAAIEQRAALLNDIVADVYGPQLLAKRGLLPPEMLFDHPGFLLPCHGLKVPGGVHLHLYACHLGRLPDESWVVVADRTQGPSGVGYAVENRVVMSRVLPQDFHSLYVERLAPFFIALRETLMSLAPKHRDDPRIVLLSPGSRSSTHFEDGYLARYLGFSMVEGDDLAVRGNQVLLKTLGGLLPVDVILRRIPDDESDPLELKSDSQLGVPGLLQAVRTGQVAVANALGSGFLEAPALPAFLPEICRALRGEELKLPSAEAWWCGREEDRRYVESHLDELVIRPAFLHRSAAAIAGWRLTREQRRDLLEAIRATPARFVGQARVLRSTAPVLNGSVLEPWRVGLRVFAVSHSGGYRVMPGALPRLSPEDAFAEESISSGEVSKDVWVLSSQPVEAVTLLKPAATAVQLRRSGTDLPSRAADNLYWLGRLAERAESMVRQLRSAIARLTIDVAPGSPREIARLIEAMPDTSEWEPNLEESDEALVEAIRVEALSLIFDEERSSSLQKTLHSLRRTATAVRDRLSIDSWRVVNQLNPETLFPWKSQGAGAGEILILLNQMINLLLTFSGLATESMTRGQGWRFLDMGRRIERANRSMRLIKMMFAGVDWEPIAALEAALEIADSTMTYRYRYQTSLQLAAVLDLVLVDESNPRSVGFQFASLAEHVKHLPGDQADAEQRAEPRIVLAAQAQLRLCDVDAFCIPDDEGHRKDLCNFLAALSDHLRRLSDALTERYLAHTGPARLLGSSLYRSEPVNP